MPYNPPRVKAAKLTGKALEESIARRERHEKDIDFYETHREETSEEIPRSVGYHPEPEGDGSGGQPRRTARAIQGEGDSDKPHGP